MAGKSPNEIGLVRKSSYPLAMADIAIENGHRNTFPIKHGDFP